MPAPKSRQMKSDSGGGAQVQYFTKPSRRPSLTDQGMNRSGMNHSLRIGTPGFRVWPWTNHCPALGLVTSPMILRH